MAADRRCSACDVHLSRYNPGVRCGPCSRARGAAAGAAGLFDSAEMRSALADGDLAAVAARLREMTGMSQQELADLVPGWTQTKVGRVERGERDTLYDLRELRAFVDAVGMPRKSLLPLFLGDPDSADVPVEGEAAGRGAESIDRRTFAGQTMAVTAATMVPAGSAPPVQVTDAHLRLLRASVNGLRRQDRSRGGSGVVRQGVALSKRARAMLDASDHTERIGRDLLALCAEIGIEAGFAPTTLMPRPSRAVSSARASRWLRLPATPCSPTPRWRCSPPISAG
ncbi:hypothetical protein GCM10022221_71190 [Actinocorallia aurea]